NGAFGIGGEVLGGHRRFAEQLDTGFAFAALECSIVKREQLLPAARGVEGELQTIECPAGARAELEHAFEQYNDSLRILEPLFGKFDDAPAKRFGGLPIEWSLESARIGFGNR